MIWPFNLLQQARDRIARLEASREQMQETLRRVADDRDTNLQTLRCFLHSNVPWTRPNKPQGGFAKWRGGEIYGPEAYTNREAFLAAVKGDIRWDERGRMLIGGKYFSRTPGRRRNRNKGAKK